MTLVSEAGSSPIAQFTTPYKGTWSSIAVNQITPDALFDSLNVYIRKGKLRNRPGLSFLNFSIFEGSVIGGEMAVTPTDKVLLAITKSHFYTKTESQVDWALDTVMTIADGDNETVDITFLETNNQYAAIIANKNYPLKRWIQGSALTNITPLVGTVPTAISVCTAANRIVALVNPHTLMWSQTLTYDSWPALAIAKIAQTNDSAICVRSLGTLNFVVYKERSLYVARAQAGSDASAFNIQFVQSVEGPAGVNSVVDVGGVHWYMTKNGRIGNFDGSSYVKWIADGVWLALQNDIDPVYAHRICGVYDYRLYTITFYYPRNGDEGEMYGMVVINLPLEGSGILQPAAFLGLSAIPISYGYEMRYNMQIDRSLVFTSIPDEQQSLLSDELAQLDGRRTYQCMMQTGMLPLPDLKHTAISFESYLERLDGNGSCTVYSVTSDILETEQGILGSEGIVIDLNSNPLREYHGFNINCRFFGLKYEWGSRDTVRYAGVTLYGRAVS